MPDPPAGTPPPACWGCDRKATATASVTVRAPSGGTATFALCRRCSDEAAASAAADDAGGVVISREEGQSGPA